MEDKIEPKDLYARHITEKGFNIAGMCLELEARLKTAYVVIDELKAAIQGQAKWAEEMEIRLKKLEPTIQVFSENDVKTMLNKK